MLTSHTVSRTQGVGNPVRGQRVQRKNHGLEKIGNPHTGHPLEGEGVEGRLDPVLDHPIVAFNFRDMFILGSGVELDFCHQEAVAGTFKLMIPTTCTYFDNVCGDDRVKLAHGTVVMVVSAIKGARCGVLPLRAPRFSP